MILSRIELQLNVKVNTILTIKVVKSKKSYQFYIKLIQNYEDNLINYILFKFSKYMHG